MPTVEPAVPVHRSFGDDRHAVDRLHVDGELLALAGADLPLEHAVGPHRLPRPWRKRDALDEPLAPTVQEVDMHGGGVGRRRVADQHVGLEAAWTADRALGEHPARLRRVDAEHVVTTAQVGDEPGPGVRRSEVEQPLSPVHRSLDDDVDVGNHLERRVAARNELPDVDPLAAERCDDGGGGDRRAAAGGQETQRHVGRAASRIGEQDLFLEREPWHGVGRAFGEVPPPEIGLRVGNGRRDAGKRGAETRRREVSRVGHCDRPRGAPRQVNDDGCHQMATRSFAL